MTPDLSVPPPKTALGGTWTRLVYGMVRAEVPSGEFEMASDGREDDERPVLKVKLDSLRIDRTEVTVARFRDFVRAAGHETAPAQ